MTDHSLIILRNDSKASVFIKFAGFNLGGGGSYRWQQGEFWLESSVAMMDKLALLQITFWLKNIWHPSW